MEVLEIQHTAVSVVVDQLSDADLRVNQSPNKSVIQLAMALVVGCFTVMFGVQRGEDEGRRATEPIEPGNTQIVVSDDEDPDSIDVDQSAVGRKSKSIIQVTVALALAGGSFAVIYAVPGGVNELGRAVMGGTIAFNVFLVADMVAFHASLVIAMIVATVSHISARMEYLIRITLWAAALCLVLTFHASAYVVVLPNHKWIVFCFGGAVTLALALLFIGFPPCSNKFLGRPAMSF